MPPLMQLTKTRGNAAFMRVMRVKGVDVNVHWTVFVVGAIILLNAGRKPVLTLVGLLCYLSVLLIHECGHLIAAQRRGSQVLEIRLYPIHGKCVFETPWSRFDHCVIAWGGVIAQAVVATRGTSNAKIIKYLHSGVPLSTVQGPVKFDALGENGAAAAFVFQWQHGSFSQVLPADATGSVSILATKPPWTS